MAPMAVSLENRVKLPLVKFKIQLVHNQLSQVFNLFHGFGIDILPGPVFKGNLFSYLRT